MKTRFLSGPIAATALLTTFAPAYAAPKPAPAKPAATAKAPVKAVADPLGIPAFAPIPTEFVFAGTREDAYKLLSRYTGGVSLADMPEPTPEELVAVQAGKEAEDIANFAALLDVKRVLAPIHFIRVRSLSYRALSDEEQDKVYKELESKVQATPKKGIEGSIASGITSYGDADVSGYDLSQKSMADAETFYQKLMVEQGGKVQVQLRGETSISVYALPTTFAVITRGPGRVIVARADGKPDVGAIISIFQRVIVN